MSIITKGEIKERKEELLKLEFSFTKYLQNSVRFPSSEVTWSFGYDEDGGRQNRAVCASIVFRASIPSVLL